jgi:hypothetical protein
MPLSLCSDLSPAGWIVASSLPWKRLVTFGPAGFEAYARLRFLPDPAYEGQSENDVEVDDDVPDADRLRMLLEVLAAHTTNRDDCFCCLWDGYGELYGRGETAVTDNGSVMIRTDEPPADAQPSLAPASMLPSPAVDVPKVVVQNRAYYLFHGSLAEAGDWGAASPWPSLAGLDMPEPAFIWPADHAWWIANDVDPHWAGIGADKHVVAELIADPRLDVVTADPHDEPPAYH